MSLLSLGVGLAVLGIILWAFVTGYGAILAVAGLMLAFIAFAARDAA